MRLFVFAILVTAFVAVTPQNEGRTRPRGLRRFSLSSPALKAASATENKEANELVEENFTDPAAPSGPQTRSRSTNPLRRGRPGLRIRGRTGDQAQEASAIAVSESRDTKSATSKTTDERKGGLRIRRPLKKITTTTTTTTTAKPIEEVATDSLPELLQSISTNEHAKEKAEGMLTEESNAVVKDEIMQNKDEKPMPVKKMDKPMTQEEPAQEEVVSEPKMEKQPQIKKLRPIPIKIRRRGKGEKSQPEESPKEAITTVVEQSETLDAKPVSSHRFSPRPRPRLQGRRRPVNRESTGVETEQDTKSSTTAAEQGSPSESQRNLRSRGDVPSLRRRPSRISLRQQATESQPEGSAVEEPIVEEANLQEPQPQAQSRNTEKNQLEKPLKEIAAHESTGGRANQRVRIRPRVQKPTTRTITENQQTRESNAATAAAILDSILGAPVSDAVRAGRPSTTQQETKVKQESQPREAAIRRSRYPTPNYGGSDLVFKGGDVQVTQIGTIEDTPIKEVQRILSGFGSRKRGLGRPKHEAKIQTNDQAGSQNEANPATDSLTASSNLDLKSDVDLIYDYYEY